jgi:hypothetical protein
MDQPVVLIHNTDNMPHIVEETGHAHVFCHHNEDLVINHTLSDTVTLSMLSKKYIPLTTKGQESYTCRVNPLSIRYNKKCMFHDHQGIKNAT